MGVRDLSHAEQAIQDGWKSCVVRQAHLGQGAIKVFCEVASL
jgi:hypothetical protein